MKAVGGWIKEILLACLIAFSILFFFKPIMVQQSSMQPSFYSYDYITVSRQAYNLFGDIERGDVIVFRSELVDDNGRAKYLIKRVIGLPGDLIEIKDGYLIRNGELVEEDYLAEQGVAGEMEAVVIGTDKLFVMGDNRAVSQDSRSESVGQIDQDEVVGKVVLRIYPFNSIKVFS